MPQKHIGYGSFTLLLIAVSLSADAQTIDFDRDVRPILSDNCFKCHGPDSAKRKAGLRLDTREGATADHDGHRAITPGNLGQSELNRRIVSDDSEERMPPAASGKSLTKTQIEVLRRWIEQG